MAAQLRRNNPEAFRNILGRMLEASGRGIWGADAATLERLRQLYSDTDDDMELAG